MSSKVTCSCGHSWNKSDSSKKDMSVCHICGKDNTMKDGGWLDKFQEGGLTDKYLGVKTNSKGKYVAPTNNGWTYEDPKLAAKIKAEQVRGVGDIDAEAMQALEQVTSYPQRKITELVTGKNQYPSQAMGIQNPYGAFAVDAVLDPTNIVGAGLLGKAAKASGKLSKASKIAKAVNTVGAPNKQIISSTGKFLNELSDKILPREVPVQQSIDAGNQWTKDWINDPATQAKVLNDLNATYSPTNQSTRQNYIDHSLNYDPNSKLYPLSQQAKDLAQIIWQGKTSYGSKQMIHADNMGVSYRHQGIPLDDAINASMTPRYGTWISRNPSYSPRQIESTVVHENYHDWLRQDPLVQTGQFHDIKNSINPKNVDLYNQWDKLRLQGKNPTDVMGKDNAYLGYLADPTEVHARIGELRKKYDIKPSTRVSSKDIQNMRAGEALPGNVVDSKFFDMFKDDPNAAHLFNRLWAAPAAVGVGAAAMANQPEQKNGGWLNKYNDGGPIQPNYNDASVSMSKDFVGDGYSNVGRNYSPAWGGQFEDGGKVKPIIVNDKNDPRLKAYKDSLDVRTRSDQTFSPGSKTRPLTKKEQEFWRDKKTGLVPNVAEYNPKNGSNSDSSYFGHFKKPTQPVEYRPKPKPTSQAIIDWIEGNTRDENAPTRLGTSEDFAMGGSMPGAVGFTYARTGSIPSNGKYAKKTKASAQNGTEMRYYQEGLDFKPKTISKNGSELKKLDQLTNFTNYNPTKPSGWLEKYQ